MVEGIKESLDGAVRLQFSANDSISKYLEQMKENKDKDAMDIMAGIDHRERDRFQSLLDMFLAERFADEHRDKLSAFDIDK